VHIHTVTRPKSEAQSIARGGGQIRFIKLMEGTQEIMSEALKGRTIADMMGEILFHIDGDE